MTNKLNFLRKKKKKIQKFNRHLHSSLLNNTGLQKTPALDSYEFMLWHAKIEQFSQSLDCKSLLFCWHNFVAQCYVLPYKKKKKFNPKQVIHIK